MLAFVRQEYHAMLGPGKAVKSALSFPNGGWGEQRKKPELWLMENHQDELKGEAATQRPFLCTQTLRIVLSPHPVLSLARLKPCRGKVVFQCWHCRCEKWGSPSGQGLSVHETGWLGQFGLSGRRVPFQKGRGGQNTAKECGR